MKIFLTSLLFLSLNICHAAHINVFFAGGQSNARATWASAIENSLVDSGVENVMMVHDYHGGNWLGSWWNPYTNSPSDNYLNDFFNPAGTGLLQQTLENITNNGDTFSFSGFFWFQGEGDQNGAAHRDRYVDNFVEMTNRLQFDISGESTRKFPIATALIDVSDYDLYLELALQSYPDPDLNELRQFISAYADSNPDVVAVDSRGFDRYDLFHLSQAGSTTFGTQMGQAFSSLLVPIPAAFWLFVSACISLVGLRRNSL